MISPDGKRQTVVSTWPEKKEDPFAEILTSSGMSVLAMPMIEIRYLSFSLEHSVSEYDWLVFTSKNGVRSFFSQHEPQEIQKIAVIGGGTAKALYEFGLKPSFTGSGHTGIGFAEELKTIIGAGNRVLLVYGNLAPNSLKDSLSINNLVERVDVYKTCKPQQINYNIMAKVLDDDYDYIAVSSPSGIKNLFEIAGEDLPRNLRIVSIGETTTAAVRNFKLEPLATAKHQSYEGLAQCVLELAEEDIGRNSGV